MALRAYILHNFWWKLLSVLLASLMWLTIETAFQKDKNLRETPVVTSSIRSFPAITITVLSAPANPNQYIVDPPTVMVEISGSAVELGKLLERQVHAFVDLSDAGDERKLRRSIQTQLPGNLRVERVTPPSAIVERTLPAK